jgi:hypothetical protein
MNVSRQTVLLIFGVTLVHLVAIAAFSPGTQPSRISHPTLSPAVSYAGPAGGAAPVPAVEETIAETRPLPATEPADLPARFRELPGTSPAPAPDPVAEIRPVPGDAANPRRLVPLPRS